MRLTTQALLAQIDAHLSRGDLAARELWAVLTALRGPDDGNPQQKKSKTCPVRRAALPLTADRWDRVSEELIPADFMTGAFEPGAFSVMPRHFEYHAGMAAQVLGIGPEVYQELIY